MRGNSSLASVIAALQDLGGYFVFTDESGREYVITSKQSFDATRVHGAETQLSLPPAHSHAPLTASADDVLDKINRDIALFQMQQDEAEVAVVTTDPDTEAESPREIPLPPPRRVRFEPIRGDLPPELQE